MRCRCVRRRGAGRSCDRARAAHAAHATRTHARGSDPRSGRRAMARRWRLGRFGERRRAYRAVGTDRGDGTRRAGASRAGIKSTWLNVPFAYHSKLLDPVLDDYAALVERSARAALGLRAVSNLTGEWLTDEQAQDPQYWVQQMRQPVRFSAGLRHLQAAGHTVFVEIGPGQTLSSLARQVLGRDAIVCASLARTGAGAQADWRTLLESLGCLWVAGAPVQWQDVERAQEGWLVPLPGYAFERQRHWVESTQETRLAAAPPIETGRPAQRAEPPTRAPQRGNGLRVSIESTLVAIWSEVLGRPSIDVHDDFFELGGDSLTAIRILSRLQTALDVTVTMEQVLSSPTIVALAASIEEGMKISGNAAETGGRRRCVSRWRGVPCGRRWPVRSTCRTRRPGARVSSGSAPTITWRSSCCTTSSPTAGRWAFSCTTSPRCTSRG